MFFDATPPLPRLAHRLGPTVESHDLGTWPLPDGVMRWVNRWSSRLLHKLLRSGSIPKPEGPALLEGSASGDPGVVREGVSEVGDVVVVRGASSPWVRPLGPMEMHVIWRIVGAPTGPVTTKI
jgi:hypothetical protein